MLAGSSGLVLNTQTGLQQRSKQLTTSCLLLSAKGGRWQWQWLWKEAFLGMQRRSGQERELQGAGGYIAISFVSSSVPP